jgi:fructose-1,6-bisphosphatase/inositol monophosphatase family enzyme
MKDLNAGNEDVLKRLIQAVCRGMMLVRVVQHSAPGLDRKLGVKQDGSLVTSTDLLVQNRMAETLRGIPGYNFMAEEPDAAQGQAGSRNTRTIIVDPLDGTRPFVVGMVTSTVMAGVVDDIDGVIAAVVGEPATGRVWYAWRDCGAWLTKEIDGEPSDQIPHRLCVWNGDFDKQATIWIECLHPFARDNGQRPMFDQSGINTLVTTVMADAKLFNCGSNGLHQALVANGQPFAGGHISAAVGGPWDLLGLLLVQEAGGQVAGYKVEDGELRSCSSYDIMSMDIAVSGCNEAARLFLQTCVTQGWRARQP